MADGEGESADLLDQDSAGHRPWDEIRGIVGRVRSLNVTVVPTETE